MPSACSTVLAWAGDCPTCVQAWPHRSVQLMLRPPAADIQRDMTLPPGEPGLLLVLAGDGCLHHWQRLLGWSALALPSALFLLYRLWFSRPQMVRTLYGLLLARHLPIGMNEAGLVLPAFGLNGWPAWSADPHVIACCQSSAVALGLTWAIVAIVLLRRQLATSRLAWLGAAAVALFTAAAGRWLVA